MTAALQPQPLSFDEFLDYDDGTENLYELVDGYPVLMPEPSRQHQSIIRYLDQKLGQQIERSGQTWEVVRNSAIRVPGRFLADGRRPDLAIVDVAQSPEERGITTVPHMLVEVASSNWANDLRDKITGYIHLGVPEYWVVDYAGQIPAKHCERGKGVKVIVHTQRTTGGYGFDKQEYIGDEVIPCITFPELRLTCSQIVQLGRQ